MSEFCRKDSAGYTLGAAPVPDAVREYELRLAADKAAWAIWDAFPLWGDREQSAREMADIIVKAVLPLLQPAAQQDADMLALEPAASDIWPNGAPRITVECPNCEATLDLKPDHEGKWRVRVFDVLAVAHPTNPPVIYVVQPAAQHEDGTPVSYSDLDVDPTQPAAQQDAPCLICGEVSEKATASVHCECLAHLANRAAQQDALRAALEAMLDAYVNGATGTYRQELVKQARAALAATEER